MWHWSLEGNVSATCDALSHVLQSAILEGLVVDVLMVGGGRLAYEIAPTGTETLGSVGRCSTEP